MRLQGVTVDSANKESIRLYKQVTLKGPHSGFRIPDPGIQIRTFHKPYKNMANSKFTFHRLLPLLLWVKTIATWKTVIESMQSLGMEWHIPDFSLSILTILLDFTMAKRLRNGKVRQISPLTPRPKLNGRQNF